MGFRFKEQYFDFQTTRRGHQHEEAFCLMQYETDDGTEREWIWNSRDGVTPFALRLRSGRMARHVRRHEDRYAPEHEPKPGALMFVDMTEERARAIMVSRWEQLEKQSPESISHLDRDDTIESVVRDWVQRREPDVLIVGEETQKGDASS